MKKIKGYIFSRPFFKERAPQHIQNIIIRDFCKNNNLHYSLSAVEFTMEESFKTLNEIINNMKNLDGIVAYSLFQLPVNDEVRQKIVNCSAPSLISWRNPPGRKDRPKPNK